MNVLIGGLSKIMRDRKRYPSQSSPSANKGSPTTSFQGLKVPGVAAVAVVGAAAAA